ncbi:hypothetical protein IGI04_020179 [Brassica rapa subsp. trilocularis]|uniref:F-box associated beta-propeller type 1 domain-containing protein n=1 Tax=Brassica rapa subsp. trilocularis TaxID=1813537 RepID=A0ABQ7MKF1_BRACM|nr:hypothetical protein IGI04_020179 [Brassica rapa subsp. trilocularis]
MRFYVTKRCFFEEHLIVLNLDRGTTQGPWRLNQFGFVLISSYLGVNVRKEGNVGSKRREKLIGCKNELFVPPLKAQSKFNRAEKLLSKIEASMIPNGPDYDQEVISEEERIMFRKVGLKMKSYLLLEILGQDTWLIRETKILNSCLFLMVLIIRFEQRDMETTSIEESHCIEIEEINGPMEISECCDGLVCFYCLTQAVRVINTATETLLPPLPLANFQRLHKDHPDPDLERDVMFEDDGAVPVPFISSTIFGFGKDNVTGRYKITRCEVFDLEERRWRWRFVTTRPLDHHQILSNQRPPCVNGLLYWLTGDEQGYPSTQTKLIVFDIHTEMFQVTSTPPFITLDASSDKIGLCNLDGRLCISEIKGDCKQEFWWRVEECNKWERIFSVDLNSTSCWFGGITSQPLTPLAISRDNNKVVLSLSYQESLVDFDLDPDSTVYHLYYSGYYGLLRTIQVDEGKAVKCISLFLLALPLACKASLAKVSVETLMHLCSLYLVHWYCVKYDDCRGRPVLSYIVGQQFKSSSVARASLNSQLTAECLTVNQKSWLGCEFGWRLGTFIVARSDAVFVITRSSGSCCGVRALLETENLNMAGTEESGVPLLKWQHDVEKPCFMDSYSLSDLGFQTDESTISCVIVGSFWNAESQMFCYGPSPSVVNDSSSLYVWELPHNLLSPAGKCLCGDCAIREVIMKESLPVWIDWQKKRVLVLCFGHE